MAYASHVALGRRRARDSASMGGDQILFNNVPIRPANLVGGDITFDVLAPFRVSLGVLPKGANVLGAMVAVKVVFNAGTTNVVTVGTLANPTLLVDATDVNEAAVATSIVGHRAGAVLAVDTEFFVWYTQTGAAAATGLASISLLYAIP